MKNFPEIIIIRYYELTGINVTYCNNGNEETLDKIYEKLENERKEKNGLEFYEIIRKGVGIEEEMI